MATIQQEAFLNIDANLAWSKIASVDHINELMPTVTQCSFDGESRHCTLANGVELKELIVSVDHNLKRLAYTATETPFDLQFHSASFQVFSHEGGSRIVWITDVKPDLVAPQLSPMLEQLFIQLQDSLQKTAV